MGMAKIRKGDKVVILSGKDKGKTGEVTKSLMPKDGKVVVAGVNIITRHKKPTQTNPQGGLERSEAPLAAFRRSRSPTPSPASRRASASTSIRTARRSASL